MDNKKVVAIVQARMGSSRLPNKMMLHLNGYPIIEWIFRRISKSKVIDVLVFAISDTTDDDVLEIYLNKIGAKVFRGKERDVLDRFYNASLIFKATHIVRICADNPLICPEEIDNLIKFYINNKCDYAYNHIPKNNLYPDGLGAEIVTFDILEKIYKNAERENQREHIFNYIWDNQDNFNMKTFNPPDKEIACPHIKLDIDTYEDYKKFLLKDLKIHMIAREIISLFKETQ